MYPPVRYTEEKKQEIIAAYQECSSMRGLQRVLEVAPATFLK